MVRVNRLHPQKVLLFKTIMSCLFLAVLVPSFLIIQIFLLNKVEQFPSRKSDFDIREKVNEILSYPEKDGPNISISCEYKSLSDLKTYELYPQVSESVDGNGRRHAFQPPKDGIVSLVCCDTTAGSMSIAVHHSWAPRGAARFLDMVNNEYFSSKVALMRCVNNFLCQFGLAGDPKLNTKYKTILDDHNWLKEGPDYRTNEYGAYRFAKGYFAYAGSGKNSRDNQLIVALKDNKPLGGGSPWEVPFGELVGSYSYDTLGKISTEYGEMGPSQRLLRIEGSSSHVAELFPNLDYVTSCTVVDEIYMG